MIMNYLKDYCEILLKEYSKEILGRKLKKHEEDIFYLKYEFYINKIINKTKDDISSYIQKYIERVKENEDSST